MQHKRAKYAFNLKICAKSAQNMRIKTVWLKCLCANKFEMFAFKSVKYVLKNWQIWEKSA